MGQSSRVLSKLAFCISIAASAALAAEPKVLAGEPNLTSRIIHYHQQDIVTVYVQHGMTTTFILPSPERIVDASCGDNKRFLVQTNGNLAFVTPGDESIGERTNLNIVNQSGNIYSFYVVEDSKMNNAHADLKLLVEPSDQSLIDAMKAPPRFVPADDVARYKLAAENAQSQAQAETERMRREIAAERARLADQIPVLVRHNYGPVEPKAPFNVHAIYNANGETIIEADPREPGAIYEMVDGKPALVDYKFTERSGDTPAHYTIPKIVDTGYIQIGKSKFSFARKQG